MRIHLRSVKRLPPKTEGFIVISHWKLNPYKDDVVYVGVITSSHWGVCCVLQSDGGHSIEVCVVSYRATAVTPLRCALCLTERWRSLHWGVCCVLQSDGGHSIVVCCVLQSDGGHSIEGPVMDAFHTRGAGYQYLSLRNNFGAGQSISHSVDQSVIQSVRRAVGQSDSHSGIQPVSWSVRQSYSLWVGQPVIQRFSQSVSQSGGQLVSH